jgi:hypothetical protein
MAEPFIVDNVIHPVKDDWAAVINISQAENSQAPRDLTGWEFYLVITKDLTWADNEAYVFKTFTPDNPTSGQVALSVPAEELTRPGTYFRGVKVKTPDGVRTTILSGTFELVAAGPKAL